MIQDFEHEGTFFHRCDCDNDSERHWLNGRRVSKWDAREDTPDGSWRVAETFYAPSRPTRKDVIGAYEACKGDYDW